MNTPTGFPASADDTLRAWDLEGGGNIFYARLWEPEGKRDAFIKEVGAKS